VASLAIAGAMGGGAVAQEPPSFIVASFNFPESALMAEIYAQALEAEGFSVDRAGINIGERAALMTAFESGQVNIFPEYVGFGLTFFTGADGASPEVAAITATNDPVTDAQSLEEVYGLVGIDAAVFGFTPATSTNAAVVRPDTAEQYGLSSMSDLAAVQGELRFGLPPGCETNPACRQALEEGYGITWPPANLETIDPCGALMATALKENAIDVAWLCSTQTDIAQNGWIVLEDDLQTQPAGNIVPVVRNDVLAQVDGGEATIAAVLDPISSQLTTAALTDLLVRVTVDQEDIEVVAGDFLASLTGEGAAAASPEASAAA
jgi:osmoprotectant transport system substrate-binding protein